MKAILFGRKLACHYCRGRHKSSECPNRDRKTGTVKLYGTTAPDGSYQPPPGVKVRYLVIPPTVHSDSLRRLLEKS